METLKDVCVLRGVGPNATPHCTACALSYRPASRAGTCTVSAYRCRPATYALAWESKGGRTPSGVRRPCISFQASELREHCGSRANGTPYGMFLAFFKWQRQEGTSPVCKGGPEMKVAATTQVPSLAGKVDPRFGRSRFLVLVDTETGGFTSLENAHDFGGTQGSGTELVREAVEAGVDAVISGCLPPKGFVALSARGIGIHIGAHGTLTDALRQLESGRLVCLSQGRVDRSSVSRKRQENELLLERRRFTVRAGFDAQTVPDRGEAANGRT